MAFLGTAALLGLFSLSLRALPAREQVSTYLTLDNGLRVILVEKHELPLINISAAVNVGTKDEPDRARGLVHLLEHCILFRGTEFRSGVEISSDIRNNGAYFNAHTGQDTSTFEISLLSERARFGLNNQKEILFNFDITPKELDAEKDVILEEIKVIQDDPRKVAASIVFQNLFRGHPYESPTYGSPQDIKAISLEQLRSFYYSYFVPANCCLAVVGDFRLEEMENEVRAVFGPLRTASRRAPNLAMAQPIRKNVEIRTEMDVKEAYLVIGLAGPDFDQADQYPIDLLTEMLGRGLNPLLFSALRARSDLVQTVTMNYSPLQYGGVIMITFTLDPKNIASVITEATRFLRKARDMNFSADDYYGQDQYSAFDFLENAKKQIRFNYQKAQESGLFLSSSLARNFLFYEDRDGKKNVSQAIAEVTSTDLRKAAARYFTKGNYVIVSIVPAKKP